MIRLTTRNGVTYLELDTVTAGYLSTAVGLARPRGLRRVQTPEHLIEVRIYGESAPPGDEHKPIDGSLP